MQLIDKDLSVGNSVRARVVVSASGAEVVIVRARARIPQEQRKSPLQNYLHPLKAAECSGAPLQAAAFGPEADMGVWIRAKTRRWPTPWPTVK